MSKIHYDLQKKEDDEDTIEISEEISEEYIRKWESLNICSDFIFCKVMQDVDLLIELIEMILPRLKISSVQVEPQRTIDIGVDIHGVRFDILATLDDGTEVDIEMQVYENEYLPKRLRYYGSIADMDMLERGMPYRKLRDSYIIMICPFDMFEQGRHTYTFTNQCHEVPDLDLKDGMTKIILNASSTMEDVDEKLKTFLDYVAGRGMNDDYVRRLDDAVKNAKMNKKWRREYMTITMRDLENREEGREEGIEIGREEGALDERNKMITTMLSRGKTPQAISDFCGYPIELVNEVQAGMFAAR